FVSPSDNLQESFGNTVAEALASGVPAVVSDWNGYRDIVDQGKTGFKIPTYWSRSDDDLALTSPLSFDDAMFDHCCVAQSVSIDLRCFRNSLQTLIDNPSLREEMSARSRDRAERLFSWPAVVRKYEDLWDELLISIEDIPFVPGHRRAMYAQPRYFDTFSGYATHALTGESSIRITRSGLDTVRCGRTLVAHHVASAI